MIDLSHSKMAFFFQVWKCKHHMEHCELNHPLRGDLISKLQQQTLKQMDVTGEEVKEVNETALTVPDKDMQVKIAL